MTAAVVDSHFHVYTKDLPLATERRHTPERDATLDAFDAVSRPEGVTHAVIVAPSFLGTDNSYLLGVLRKHPDRLRGVVTVDPGFSRTDLVAMDRVGVVGIRHNLFRKTALPDFGVPDWRRLHERVAELGWHIELYAEAEKLDRLLPLLLETPCNIVIAHFGSPSRDLGLDDPGFRRTLDALEAGRAYVKLSAPYRLFGADPVPYARALLAAGGPERLVWGSDWPWVSFEAGRSYRGELDGLGFCIPDPRQREVILSTTPLRLYRLRI
jgi:predicted TIM-barrel fold metal-dependent hydrolase